MQQERPAIVVNKVDKTFHLPHDRPGSIKHFFTGWKRHFSKSRRYETQHALRDISFEVRPGEFFGIVGRNGSGKSTLLKMLAGIYEPTNGTVSCSGKLVPFIELGVGFNPELTGKENIYLNGALMGFSKKEIDAQYDDIVAFAELEKFMDQKLKNYSSGMQVRLAFSVATTAKADILLIDEVLAVGDADFQRKCFDYFQQLKGSKTTVVFVTHDMNAVREYCDRAILIEKSRLVLEGRPDEVAAAYSRMFIEDSQASARDNDKRSNRWGDNVMTYNHIHLSEKVLTSQIDTLVITTRIRARQTVEKPMFGFSIKNASQMMLIGTNTQLEGKKIGRLTAGQVITVNWFVPNIFNDGTYTIDISAVYKGGMQTADWWERCAGFSVVKEQRTAFLVNPPMKVELDSPGKN